MNKLFLLLTTNTAASCSLLFALYPCYSTWFLEFITYSATLSPLFLAFYVCYSTWGFHDFLEEKNLFPHFMHALLLLQKIQSNTKLVSIRLGVLLSSLLCTLLDLGLPHADPMQGESWDQPSRYYGTTCITNNVNRINFTQMQNADCLYLSWHDRPRNPVLTKRCSWSIIEGS